MGTVQGEKYSLKWNDFTSNLSSAFNELRDDEDFFDITLLTEESEIRCHKLILGACSPHFRAIIKRLAAVQNPAIYLRGVRHEDIKNILEFMYLGQVSVSQEDLDSFLSVAQDLCIKGLTQNDQGATPSTSEATPHPNISRMKSEPSTSFQQSPTPPPTKRPRMNFPKNGPPPQASRPDPILQPQTTPTKREPKVEIPEEIEVLDEDDHSQMLSEETGYEDYYEAEPGPSDPGAAGDDDDGKGVHQYQFQFSQEGGIAPIGTTGRWKCLACSKQLSNRSNAMRHYRDHHLAFEKHNCEVCGKEYNNISCLRQHLKTSHGLTMKDLKCRVMPSPRL